MCGGTALHPTPKLGVAGLSPRVRGNRVEDARLDQALRSIPACAGEPRKDIPKGLFGAVYPRVCGGTDSMVGYRTIPRGLSPRVRGNLW